jgi:hypothetical protein
LPDEETAPGFAATHFELQHEIMSKVTPTLLKGLAIALKLDENWFDPFFRDPVLIQRAICYPAGEGRAGKHTDNGIFTILIQEYFPTPSLRVYAQDEWIDAPCIENALVVNLGDMLQLWTKSLFVSTPHEVIHKNLNESRISIPFFVYPSIDTLIKPFETEEEFCDKVQKIFEGVHPKTGEYFKYMRENKLLDLSSREGKAPGGYMTELSEKRVPFIFMNAVGTKRDVDTLLHEGGHSIHAFQARDQILKSYRSSPLEFAEVASMSMELLGRPFFQHVYKQEDLERVKKEQLIKIVEFFPFMSMIDSFQHWVYTTEDNGREARGKKWQELNRRFQPYLDMSGMDEIEKTRWQYSHIYTVPFYYIEYGIAQVGALQVWKNSLKDPKKAVDDYLAGLALGGSKPLPELFKAANISFAMDKNTLKELVSIIKDQVA